MLGDKIVNALNLQESVDTLGRWKAHHLAELILAVRDAKEADKAAAEIILENALLSFGHRTSGSYRYSQACDLKKIAHIVQKIVNKR